MQINTEFLARENLAVAREVLANASRLRMPEPNVRILRELRDEIEWSNEINRLNREARCDFLGFAALELVGMQMLWLGSTYPSGSSARTWLEIPGFFFSMFGGFAFGSFVFRKFQSFCLRIGPRNLR